MTPTRFQTLLDARGPRIGRWPEADRLGAEALLARSDRARAALAEAEALDRALAALPHEPPAPLLRAAILDIPDREDRGVGRSLGAWTAGRRGLAAGSTAIAASAVIGFAVGAWWPAEPPLWQSEDLAVLVYGGVGLDEVLR